MKPWNKKELEAAGYTIENAKITSVDLSMADHGVFTLSVGLDGGSWGCVYGGYVIGKGYLDASEFEGCKSGVESIMRIMDTIGVERFNDMTGKYVRVAVSDKWGHSIKIIGNIIKDKWFDIDSFFEDKKAEGGL